MRQLFLIFFIVLVVGCSGLVSTDQIAENVKTQIQNEFDTQDQFKKYHLKVIKLTVIKQEGNQYKGLAEVEYEDKIHRISVNILMDGENYIWEIPAENFNFIRNSEIEKYQQELSEQISHIGLETNQSYSDTETEIATDVKADGADEIYDDPTSPASEALVE